MMSDMHDPQRRRADRFPPGEAGLESREALLRGIDSVAGRLDRLRALAPEDYAHLNAALNSGALVDVALGYAAFHPLSKAAVIQTLREFSGRVIRGDQDDLAFMERVSANTVAAIEAYPSMLNAERNLISRNYPEVDLPRLLRAKEYGVLEMSEVVGALQLQILLDEASSKIAVYEIVHGPLPRS